MGEMKHIPGPKQELDPIQVQKAMFDEKVVPVYFTGFTVNISEFETVIGLGLLVPGDAALRYTHRLHLPIRTAQGLHAALTQILTTIAQAQAAVRH